MIRIAKEKEFEKLTKIWEESVKATHTFLSLENIDFFRPKILNEYLYAVEVYVYEENKEILGFIGVLENKVEMLFITPLKLKKGIGKKLLSFAINTLNINELDVNEQNENAVNFYKHMNFKVIGRSKTDNLGKPFPLLHLKL